MAATARGNMELQNKAKKELASATDPLEKLRLVCLSRAHRVLRYLKELFFM